jgi:DNA repair exonuclease SbcCD ATPase subunit
MKKRGIDHRQDSGGVSKANRVDRVFVPSPGTITPRPTPRETSEIATELLAATTSTRAPTEDAIGGADAELSLRRQLSRLQRQLAESQRELANKDDEVAAEVEKRLQMQRELDEAVEAHRVLHERIEELEAYATRTAGIEERLQDSIATADELGQLNARERAATAEALTRIDQLNVSFEETRALWNAERTMLEERSANEIAMLDGLRKAAVEASSEALNAQASRLREAHESQLAELRATHEQSLATLRGELEPQAVQAHSLAEERERMIAELATVRNEAIRDTVEREQDYKRELKETIEGKDAELAALARTHAADLSRAIAERDEQIIAFQQTIKSAETQRVSLEEQAKSQHKLLKSVQRDAAELKERVTALEVDKQSVDEALERARATIETMAEEKRQLSEQTSADAAEIRRNATERRKFVAYLEEGLALLGALPPTSDAVPVEPASPIGSKPTGD